MRWTGALTAAALVVLLGAPAAGVPLTAPPALAVGDLGFAGYDRVVHLDAYEEPVTAVGYADGVGARVLVPVTNTGDRPAPRPSPRRRGTG